MVAVVLALGAVVAGLLIVIVGDDLADPETIWSDLSGALASTLLTAGIVSLLYEWQIREAVVDDIYRLVGLDAGIRQARLEKLQIKRPDVLSFLSDTPRHLHIVVDVEKWHSEEWPLILHRCERVPMDLTIVLPAQDSPSAAKRVGIEPKEHTERIRRVENSIESEWRSKATNGRLRPGSSVMVYDVLDCPPYEVRQTESYMWILLQPPIGRRLTPPRELAFKFTIEPASIGLDIATEILENLGDLNRVWSQKPTTRTPSTGTS